MDILPQNTLQKQCTKCKKLLPATSEFFGKSKNTKDGLYPSCKMCKKIYQKPYNDAHVEYRKSYYQENKLEISRKKKQHYVLHREEVIEQSSQYYYDNHESIRTRRNELGRTEQGRLIYRAHKHKRKAQKKACSGSYTAQQIQEQVLRQKSRCYYCKKRLGKVYHIDHVVPLSRGGSNDISNIVIACPTCNMRKNDKLLHEWPEGNRLL